MKLEYKVKGEVATEFKSVLTAMMLMALVHQRCLKNWILATVGRESSWLGCFIDRRLGQVRTPAADGGCT